MFGPLRDDKRRKIVSTANDHIYTSSFLGETCKITCRLHHLRMARKPDSLTVAIVETNQALQVMFVDVNTLVRKPSIKVFVNFL